MQNQTTNQHTCGALAFGAAAVLREEDEGDDDEDGDEDEGGDEDGGAPRRPAATTRGGTDLPRRTASWCASWRETSSVLRCSATT